MNKLLKLFQMSEELKIGITKDTSSNLQAHAWVEHNNKVIIGKLKNLDRALY